MQIFFARIICLYSSNKSRVLCCYGFPDCEPTQTTLIDDFCFSEPTSPKIGDRDLPAVDAMTWFLVQMEPQVGQLSPNPIGLVPKNAWVELVPQCLHRTQILSCIL